MMPMKQLSSGTALQTLAECKRWLAALPLTNAQFAQSEIATQLNLLADSDVPAMERLKIAEHLRETVDFIQAQLSRKYLNKPLPLGAPEGVLWDGTNALWQAMGNTYRHCLDAALAGEAEIAGWTPLIAQRCLRYTGLLMLEQYRVYREASAALWQQLHTLYRIAEEGGFAGKPVKDSLNRQQDASTCQAAYVHALLIAAASPHQLSARHLNVLDKWLDKWAVRVPLAASKPENHEVTLWAVDVDGNGGPFAATERMAAGNWRYLHTERLAGGVRKRIKFLRKGGSPGELDLGGDCVQPGCEAFLTDLYRQWCEPPTGRATSRRAGAQNAEVVFGMTGAHFCISGMKPFVQPSKRAEYSRDALQDLQIFGHVRERQVAMSPRQAGVDVTEWEILDESALGFRLARAGTERGQVVFNQLLAVRPTDASAFVLGGVKWLNFQASGEAQLGMRILPGAVVPVAARQVKLQAAEPEFTPAFRLPPIPALQQPETLVLPRGWFKPHARVEIYENSLRTAKLTEILEKGSDYERVGFMWE